MYLRILIRSLSERNNVRNFFSVLSLCFIFVVAVAFVVVCRIFQRTSTQYVTHPSYFFACSCECVNKCKCEMYK